MPVHSVPFSRGLDWISEGFALFRQNPLVWIVNVVIFLAISMGLSVIPLLGAIASMLLQPVLVAGMLLGCQALERGEELRIEHLFDGFKQHSNPLLMVGLLTALASLAVGFIVFLIVGGTVGLSILGGAADMPALAVGGAMVGFLLSGLVGLALFVPVTMAVWFAPALVVFNNMQPVDAMKASFLACWSNMLPFLLYGLVVFVLSVLAMIPLGLGLFVLGPVVVASVYAGYRDIF